MYLLIAGGTTSATVAAVAEVSELLHQKMYKTNLCIAYMGPLSNTKMRRIADAMYINVFE